MGATQVIGRVTSGSGVSSFEDLIEGFDLTGNGDKVVGINTGATALEPKVNSASVAYGGITGTLADQTDLQSALDGKAASSHTHTLSNITDAGTAASKDTGTSSDNVPLLDGSGKLPTQVIPDLAISAFLGNFTDLTAALADGGVNASQRGDWFTLDTDESYIVSTDSPTLSGHVTKLKTPGSGVSSVNGETGAVTLNPDHLDDTSTTNKFVSSTEKTKLSNIEENADVTDIVNIASSINGATAKTTPIDADLIGIIDTADTNAGKKVSFTNLKAFLKTYFDTIYQAVLVSGTNIKTVNSTSLLGSGNIVVTAGTPTPQTLTASTDLTSSDDLDFGISPIVELNLDANKDCSAYLKTASVTAGKDFILRITATGANRIWTAGTSIDKSDFDGGVFNIDQDMTVEFKIYLLGSDIVMHSQNLAV